MHFKINSDILLKILQKSVLKDAIDSESSLVQMMAMHQTSSKALYEPIMTHFALHPEGWTNKPIHSRQHIQNLFLEIQHLHFISVKLTILGVIDYMTSLIKAIDLYLFGTNSLPKPMLMKIRNAWFSHLGAMCQLNIILCTKKKSIPWSFIPGWNAMVLSIAYSALTVLDCINIVQTRQIWGIWKLRPAYSPQTPNLGKNRWCFVPCDLEIW